MDNTDDFEEIRPPDAVFRTRLIGGTNDHDYLDNTDNTNNIDNELKMALDVSLNEFEKSINDAMDEANMELMLSMSLEEDIQRNIKISEDRRKSLENFYRRIQTLIYTHEDKELKDYLESVLSDYFDLKIDETCVPEGMYEKVYRLIDSYYLIPVEKKLKRTAIPKEEDELLRVLFLEKKVLTKKLGCF